MYLSKEKVKPPRNLRSARRSLVKNQISTPISAPTALQGAIAAPKKIIKALYDYQAQRAHELSFARGDFFHVIGRENDDQWFEACNPATNSRGIVPVSYFQVLDKSERNLAVAPPPQQKADSGFLDNNGNTTSPNPGNGSISSSSSGSIGGGPKKMQPLYGVVLYDFQAERSDELDAKAGEPIIVIAQSNVEWFVAKPIGRLGGPGLIPVSFVEVRDALTGRPVGQAPSNIPPVEEWKKMTQGYEASSISAGSSISSGTSARPQHDDHPDNFHDNITMQHSTGAIVEEAKIDSYILEGDQYWFIVYARLNNGRHRVLYRLYEDFYDFQINLLNDFPVEAGKEDRERILPYMPGPLTDVDEDITAERQRDLNKYCAELLSLPRYLAESSLVQNQLFGIHEGDIETDQCLLPTEEENESIQASQPPSATTTTTTTTTAAATPTTTVSSSTSTPRPAVSTGTVKLKIAHKDDIFAIKVPADSTLEQLHEKVKDRLGFPVSLRYKDDTSGQSLPLETETDMEDAFASAIKLGKLTVYAERI